MITTKTQCKAKDVTKCRYHGSELTNLRQQLRSAALNNDSSLYLDLAERITDIEQAHQPPKEEIDELLNNSLADEVVNLIDPTTGKKSPIHIAAKGDLPVRCKNCSEPLTQAVFDKLNKNDAKKPPVKCSNCKEGMNWGQLSPPYIVDVRYDEAKYIANPETIKQQKWYHVTHSKTWHEDVTEAEVFVHIGSKEAALDRFAILNRYSIDSEYYLYELEFNPDSQINPNVLSDENEWPGELRESDKNCPSGQINRYINSWEEPGSISIISSPHLFKITKQEKL